MLRFNTFRAQRYLRSKFVEGKYLLASEATDLELELMDNLRRLVEKTIGDVAFEDAWLVQRLSDTQLLVKPGEAWFKGLPFDFRSGKDHLVTGAILTSGVMPVGVVVTDDVDGLGKIITLNSGSTTPSNTYRVVITAKEELITEIDDPFLQNANLTESTSQKIRLNFQFNLVPDSLQTETPIPYRDENSTSVSVTNFPNTGGQAAPNLANQITISPTASGNGEQISITPVTGSEGIDGRDVEIVVRNNTGLGGGNPIPNSPTGQAQFENGRLIDSNGSLYHINAIFNDTVSTQVVIRIDKEPDQPNPEIINGKPYTLIKRKVYATDNVNGSPQGKLFWPVATVVWNSTLGIVHDDSVTDLRNVAQDLGQSQEVTNQKFDLFLTDGGSISYANPDPGLLEWASDFNLVNPHGAAMQIPAGEAVLMEGGSLAYEMDLVSGGSIARGNLAVTAANFGATVVLSGSPDLSQVRKGNIFVVGSDIVMITSVDNVSKTISVSPSTTGSGAGVIYQDSFGPAMAPLMELTYVLAVRKNNEVYLDGGQEFAVGETAELGDGVTLGLLTFIGSTDENDDSPFYTSTNIVTQGGSLVQAISELDDVVGDIQDALAQPIYDERILYPSGLVSGTTITIPQNSRNSNIQETYDTAAGDLEIFVNQTFKFQGADWNAISTTEISFTFDLPNDAEVHFRKDTLGGSTGGGGGTSDLQEAYDLGRTITTTIGNPVEISGPSGEKLLKVNGDMEVTGVIDPTGLELTPQSSNPLGATKQGIWVNTSNQLIMETGSGADNISQQIEDIQSGFGITGITRMLQNNTASTIPALTPVYSPSAGSIAPANGSTDSAARLLGVTIEEILPTAMGKVAIAGYIEDLGAFTHGSYLYLTDVDGEMSVLEPTLDDYPAGFNVVIIGLVEGTNLILRLQHVGQL